MHLHFHHHHDIAGCVDDHPEFSPGEQAILATLTRMEMRLMATVNDSVAAAVTAINDLIAEVNNLKSQIAPAVDTSALDAAVAAAQAVLPQPAPAPVVEPTPAPADVPAQPADVPVTDPVAPADGTQPVTSIPSVPLA